MSKLARLERPPVVKGSIIKNPDGTKYKVVKVFGSTVTADRVPTALEITARALGTCAGVIRAAYRNARFSAKRIVTAKRAARKAAKQ